jgi:hypothetical protein
VNGVQVWDDQEADGWAFSRIIREVRLKVRSASEIAQCVRA